MATKSPKRAHSNGRLEEAMALLIQNQAAFVAQQSAVNDRFARADERFARIDGRFARIEERLDKIEQTLEDHHKILLGLLESIRKEIGIKTRA